MDYPDISEFENISTIPFDVVILVDNTASMGEACTAANTSSLEVSTMVNLLLGHPSVSFAVYGDYDSSTPDNHRGGWSLLGAASTKSDEDAWFGKYMKPMGGGGQPEAQRTAFNELLNMSKSYIVLHYTDAPPHGLPGKSLDNEGKKEQAYLTSNGGVTEWLELCKRSRLKHRVVTFLTKQDKELINVYAKMGDVVVVKENTASVITETMMNTLYRLWDQSPVAMGIKTKLKYHRVADEVNIKESPVIETETIVPQCRLSLKDTLVSANPETVFKSFDELIDSSNPDSAVCVATNPILGEYWRLIREQYLKDVKLAPKASAVIDKFDDCKQRMKTTNSRIVDEAQYNHTIRFIVEDAVEPLRKEILALRKRVDELQTELSWTNEKLSVVSANAGGVTLSEVRAPRTSASIDDMMATHSDEDSVHFRKVAAAIAKMQEELRETTENVIGLRDKVAANTLTLEPAKQDTEALVRKCRDAVSAERAIVIEQLEEARAVQAAGSRELERRLDALAEAIEENNRRSVDEDERNSTIEERLKRVTEELVTQSTKSIHEELDDLRRQTISQQVKNSEMEEQLKITREDIENLTSAVNDVAEDHEDTQENLTRMLDEHDAMFERFEEKRLEVEEQAKIEADESLAAFYTTIRNRLVSVFTGLMAIQSGMIHEVDTGSTIERSWRFLGDRVADLVPGGRMVSSLTNALLDAGKRVSERGTTKVSEKLLDLSWSGTALNRTAERVARRLTNIYSPALRSLLGDSGSPKALKKLGIGAVARIVVFLASRHDSDHDEYWNQLSTTDEMIVAMCVCVSEDDEKKFRVPGTNRLQNKMSQIWSENGMFSRSGVVVRKKGEKRFYVRQEQSGFKKKYGFRNGTKEEVSVARLSRDDRCLKTLPPIFLSMMDNIDSPSKSKSKSNTSLSRSSTSSRIAAIHRRSNSMRRRSASMRRSKSGTFSVTLRRVDANGMSTDELRDWFETNLGVQVLDARKWNKKSMTGSELFEKFRESEDACDRALKNAGISMNSHRARILAALQF